jgi:hypothetical protein
MKKLRSLAWLGLLLATGCAGPKPEPTPQARGDANLLEPYLLQEKPETVQSFTDVRDKAEDGAEVIVQGRVPPETTKPFLDNRAAFIVMAPEDLADPKIREELSCEEAAT